MVKTMVHELGHRAYYHLMEGRGRQSWDEFFEAMQEPPPDLDDLIRRWEAWADEGADERQRSRRSHFHEFYPEFKKMDPQAAEWLRMAVESMRLDREEKFDRYHGLPTRTSVPALEKLREKKDEVRVFSEPVTAYSATNAKELFAEAFAHYLTYGPRALQPRLRDQFRRTLPKMKLGTDDADDADGRPD
jgi:hypothetical protein